MSALNSVTPALELAGVTKRYGATVGLDGASFAVRSGAVHALLGENGAGKSTVVKLLSGLLRSDAGSIKVEGALASFNSPAGAHKLGIQTAFQELSLLPNLTVNQNILLPYQPVSSLGMLQPLKARRQAEAILAKFGLDDIDPGAHVGELDLPVRQKIEIVRAISRQPKILLLDEPTSALSASDVEWLFELMKGLSASGVTILFISHRLPEVRAICDDLTILRNGRDVGTYRTNDISDDEIIRQVIGRTLSLAFPGKIAGETQSQSSSLPTLSVDKLASGKRLHDVTFELWPGEILGVSALQGMGQLELFRTAFGLERATGGTIAIDGQRVTLSSPHDAIEAHIGLSLVPEDRKTEGLFLGLSGRDNVSLPVISRFARFGWISDTAEDLAVLEALKLVNVPTRAMYTPLQSVQWGQSTKDRHGEVAAHAMSSVDDVRPDAGRRHRDQERDFSAHASLRGRRRGHSLLFDGYRRGGQSLRSRPGAVSRFGRFCSVRQRNNRGADHALRGRERCRH
jgi:ribose transport system ATP-binding protein